MYEINCTIQPGSNYYHYFFCLKSTTVSFLRSHGVQWKGRDLPLFSQHMRAMAIELLLHENQNVRKAKEHLIYV